MQTLIRLVALYLVLIGPANAQCPPDVNTVAGSWKESSDHYNPPFNYRADTAGVDKAWARRVLDDVLAIARQAFPDPAGFNANYDMQFPFASFHAGLPHGYFLRTGFFNFYCEGGAPREIDSTNVWLTVEVNGFASTRFLSVVTPPQAGPRDSDERFNADADENYTVAGKTVYAIPDAKGASRGVEYYSADDPGAARGGPGIQYFLLSRDSAPLFTAVSRRDYLLQFQQELDAYRQAELVRLNNWLAAAPGDESAVRQIANFSGMMDKYSAAVAAYLANAPTDEMEKPLWDLLPLIPANTDAPQVEFTNYAKKQLVYFNDAYMNPAMNAAVPQFILVELRAEGAADDPRFRWRAELREKFSSGLDLQRLAGLIAEGSE